MKLLFYEIQDEIFSLVVVQSCLFAVSGTPPLVTFSHCEVRVAQACPTLCNPRDHAVHGILQARILEWVAVPFSRGSQSRDRTQVSHTAGGFFTI